MKLRRRASALVVALGVALLVAGHAAAATRSDVVIPSTDGTRLAATLELPDGAPPAGGWPGVILLHGLGGDRSSSLALADAMGLPARTAVLAFDARGHGASGGLVDIDGPREVADTQAVFSWLARRPDVAAGRIGGFGISYGGGALWGSLVAGTPWAALVVNISWTDLRSALMPQNYVKSGVVAGLLGSIPPARLDPEVTQIRDAAYAGDLATVVPWAAQRSSLSRLRGVKTPVLMVQGRRDFLFGLDQVLRAWPLLSGPKRLWLGLHGHPPSTFPAADTPAMLTESAGWLDRYLGVAGGRALDPRPIAIAPESWTGAPVRLATLPAVKRSTLSLPGTATIAASGRVQRSTPALRTALEVFGSPVVTLRTTATGGWSHLVATLSARTPTGKEIVVAGGGVPVAAGAHVARIVLGNQATFVPRGSRLTLTLGSSSLAQSAGNLLYLDLPMAPGAGVRIGPATLRLPALVRPVSR